MWLKKKLYNFKTILKTVSLFYCMWLVSAEDLCFKVSLLYYPLTNVHNRMFHLTVWCWSLNLSYRLTIFKVYLRQLSTVNINIFLPKLVRVTWRPELKRADLTMIYLCCTVYWTNECFMEPTSRNRVIKIKITLVPIVW